MKKIFYYFFILIIILKQSLLNNCFLWRDIDYFNDFSKYVNNKDNLIKKTSAEKYFNDNKITTTYKTKNIYIMEYENGLKTVFKDSSLMDIISEVAFCKLSRYLKLGLVPPTAITYLENSIGSEQLFIENGKILDICNDINLFLKIDNTELLKSKVLSYIFGIVDRCYSLNIIYLENKDNLIPILIDNSNLFQDKVYKNFIFERPFEIVKEFRFFKKENIALKETLNSLISMFIENKKNNDIFAIIPEIDFIVSLKNKSKIDKLLNFLVESLKSSYKNDIKKYIEARLANNDMEYFIAKIKNGYFYIQNLHYHDSEHLKYTLYQGKPFSYIYKDEIKSLSEKDYIEIIDNLKKIDLKFLENIFAEYKKIFEKFEVDFYCLHKVSKDIVERKEFILNYLEFLRDL